MIQVSDCKGSSAVGSEAMPGARGERSQAEAWNRGYDAGRRDGNVPVLVSVVVPCCNEHLVLTELHVRLSALAERLVEEGCETEIVLVDDGSRDRTWSAISALAGEDARVRGVRLSRNFGHQAALACGYAHARGDAIVSLDADLQDPPEVVPAMVRAWQSGADVVFGVRRARTGETLFKRSTAWFFYWLLHRLGAVHIRRNVGDFRLLSRRALDAARGTRKVPPNASGPARTLG